MTIKSELIYEAHTGVLTHKASQPTEGLILERNNELRKNVGAIKDLGGSGGSDTWGRQVASIPEIVMAKAIRDGFDLYSGDMDTAGKEMRRFFATEAGKLCLIR